MIDLIDDGGSHVKCKTIKDVFFEVEGRLKNRWMSCTGHDIWVPSSSSQCIMYVECKHVGTHATSNEWCHQTQVF
jgi:hypothetical protein